MAGVYYISRDLKWLITFSLLDTLMEAQQLIISDFNKIEAGQFIVKAE
jgi:hypothetical protein